MFGAVDRKSKLLWVTLMSKKSEAGKALRKLNAFCEAQGVKCRSFHCDGAPEFVGPDSEASKFIKEELKCQLTYSAAHEPRGNGLMERNWRWLGDDMRSCLKWSCLENRYAAYALLNCTRTSWHLPSRDSDDTPWSLFTGKPSEVRHLRPFGCVCYPKVRELNASEVL